MKNILKKIRSFLYLLPNITRALTQPPETRLYPEISQSLPDRFRGSVLIREANCIGCGLCVIDCPSKALIIEKKEKDQYRLIYHHDRCCYCGQCEISCRFNAIFLSKAINNASSIKEDFLIILADKKSK